jgi:hypothetical protein
MGLGAAGCWPGGLDTGHRSDVESVSCASAGNCAAGGWYLTVRNKLRQQAWVASERNGRWAKAQEVPGSGAERRRVCRCRHGVLRRAGQLRRRRVLHPVRQSVLHSVAVPAGCQRCALPSATGTIAQPTGQVTACP